MAEVYQRLGDYEKARSFFIKFFNTGKGKPFLLVKSARILGDFYQDRKDYGKARYWFKAANMTFAKFKSKGAQSAAADAAYSVFRLSDQLFYKYLSIAIPSDPAKQEKVLNQKLSLVDQINKEMTKVINFDDGYTMVSALNRLGQAYQHLTFALLNTPLPKGLTKERLVQVKKLLQDKVAPFKENAITSYKKALEKGRSLDTYNNDYLNTLFELSKIDSSFKLYRAPFIISADLIQYDSNTLESYPAFEDMMKQPESKVLEEMSKILSKDPESSEALYTLANYYHKKGFSGISDIYIEKTNDEFKKGSKYFLMKGMNRYLENKRREAINEFNAALKSDSEDSGLVAGVNLAALYMQYGGYDKGYEILQDRFSSPLIPQSERHKVSNNYAIGLLIQQRPDEALAEFKEALQLKSDFVDTLGNLAIFYKVVQINKKEAEQYFSQYKKLANRQVNLDRIKLMEKL
jgi:Tfp pilus assembly protein PilF